MRQIDSEHACCRGCGQASEFSYTLNRRGVEKMIAVVMEPSCRDTARWQGVVGLRLGSSLYVDCSEDAGFDAGVEAIAAEVRARAALEEGLRLPSSRRLPGDGAEVALALRVRKSLLPCCSGRGARDPKS